MRVENLLNSLDEQTIRQLAFISTSLIIGITILLSNKLLSYLSNLDDKQRELEIFTAKNCKDDKE